jgi:lipopolysaccharide O-acetyltransferase
MAGRGLWVQTIGEGRVSFGANVNLSDWVHIGVIDHVLIGNGCLLGSKVLITDHSHGAPADIMNAHLLRPNARKLHSKGPVVLEDNVWLGDSVVVLPGVCVGRNAIVGANSVVTRDIPTNTVWTGIPAKQIWPIQK